MSDSSHTAPATPEPGPAATTDPAATADPVGQPVSPVPPADPAASPARRSNLDPVALVALITGALGLGAIPLSLGIIGRHRAKRSGRDDHGFSTVGIVLGAASMAAWFVLGLFFVAGIGMHGIDRYDRVEFGPGMHQWDEWDDDSPVPPGMRNGGPGGGMFGGDDQNQGQVDPGNGFGGGIICEQTDAGTSCRGIGDGTESRPGQRGNSATPSQTPTP